MSELQQILDLAESARRQGDEVCLVTVVGAEGSSYRKPGARMLLTRSGQRAGTISGGCLEGEVGKKAWFLTVSGPSIQRYSSFFDEDSDIPYGLGCGGTVILLLERGPAVSAVLNALRHTVEQRETVAILTAGGDSVSGTQWIATASGEVLYVALGLDREQQEQLREQAAKALASGSHATAIQREGPGAQPFFCERIEPPPALWIFGAGNDAQPLVEFAHKLGWDVTVADGRAQLTRPERFPLAQHVFPLTPDTPLVLGAKDAAVLMTHSYEQDRNLLARLLPLPLAYLGVLGPRRRTMHILQQLTASDACLLKMTAEDAMARLHSPVGLSICAHSPAAIALSIAAEIHAVLAGATRQEGNAVAPVLAHAR